METIAYVITGRGARIKHIAHEGQVLCPQAKAQTPAVNRFEKLPVCGACEAAYSDLPVGEEENSEEVEIHFSARVTTFLASFLGDVLPQLCRDLEGARLVRNGRGFTAFTTTTRRRAEVLVAEMKEIHSALEDGRMEKGLKGGMNFQPEAVAKGIEHVEADLAGETA